LKELRQAFDAEAVTSGNPALLLSVAVGAGKSTVDNGYEVAQIAQVVDWIGLMSYDLHGSWDTSTGHNSPLFPRSGETAANQQLNVEWAAKYWVQKGCPPSKLVIGMPTYGRGFQLTNPLNHGMGAAAQGTPQAGPLTSEAGFLAYYEVCSEFLQSGGTRVFHPEHQVPYAYKNNQWVGYDDVQSLTGKVNWLKTQGPQFCPAWWHVNNAIDNNTINYYTIDYYTTDNNTIDYNTIDYYTIDNNTIDHYTIDYNTINNTIDYNAIDINPID
ncbi:Acidic mammalian chitinase, partial [Lamellibrachia satsuma]